MATTLFNEDTRITSAGTWTEVCGATKGLSGFASGDVAHIDFLAQNMDVDDATILVAITATSSQPSADTDAFLVQVKAQYATIQLKLILTGTQHLWVKSDQTDTRVLVQGAAEDI